ncbi:TAXI family TRAP transporter solute-binding subunit [Ruegeria atlantica]|uniref:TAXI family TRAP transporter solute-binding subunit n=1 Tax=Ruegeria atlantica TaxID=81569 RepID=UPI0024941FA5|nr:TAXI family TRAP transporter solute-binding subunit [Ruegeria atlantica]
MPDGHAILSVPNGMESEARMRLWFLFGGAVALAVLVGVFSRLHPPGSMMLAAGPEGGAYETVARDYAEILARDDIQLEILDTAGSVENAELLSAGDVDAAFLQGGIRVDPKKAEAVGAAFFEPIIFLVNEGATIPKNPALWTGLRINSGAPGSGTAAAFRDFEKAVGLNEGDNTHFSIPYAKAAAALLDGDLDIAVYVAPIEAPYLKAAYAEPGLRVLALDHVQAISRRLEYATVVTVPAGGMSLDPVLPPRPVELIAIEARLVVRPDLHPALINRLTMAAIELHSARGIIADPGAFPNLEGAGMTINNTARQLIVEGPSTWHNWLPYWIAAQINRVLLLLLPFFFIVVPLIRLVPMAYAYAMRWRVWQHYPEIREIEEELANNPGVNELREMQAHLNALDERLATLRLPAAYRQGLYDARLHVELVQKRVAELQQHSQT